MKKILIAGGGISGLAMRYRLSKTYPDAEITLIEKSNRLGGCIASTHSPYFFEGGPRTFKASRSPHLLALIEELGLSKELIFSSPHAKKRYLWTEGKLQPLPTSPLGLFSPLMRPLLPALLKEWKQPYPWEGDETIASFVKRRLGTYAAETLFDPLTLGIYAGKIEELSISACFPQLKALEMEYGSLTKGFLKKKKEKKRRGLFTLRGGIETLIRALAEKGRGEIHLNRALESLDHEHLVLALPAPAAATFFKDDPAARTFFDHLPTASLTAVNIAYDAPLLKEQGFGYLVPTKEKEMILGTVFDSSLFPSQNRLNETRLTVMMQNGGENEALDALNRHLRISRAPSHLQVTHYPHAVPQFQVDHLKRLKLFEKHLATHYPHITCIGNYLRGASLEHCVVATHSKLI